MVAFVCVVDVAIDVAVDVAVAISASGDAAAGAATDVASSNLPVASTNLDCDSKMKTIQGRC